MAIESLDTIINTIFYYLQAFTKPENLLLIILIIVNGRNPFVSLLLST